jgi:hypothetical protein
MKKWWRLNGRAALNTWPRLESINRSWLASYQYEENAEKPIRRHVLKVISIGVRKCPYV